MKTRYRILQRLTPFVPRTVRDALRTIVSLSEYDLARRQAGNPYLDESGQSFAGSPACLGVIVDTAQHHKHYISACRELNISYRVIDLLADNWVERVCGSACDAFLIWPSSASTVLKAVFDSRLKIMEEDLKRTLYPTWKECWLTEHKPRLRDWMDAHGIAHPRSWVVYNEAEALALAKTLELPIVSKTATGASGSGVRIIRDRAGLIRQTRQAFNDGILPRGHDPRDRQRGFIYLQEYLPDVAEWRMVRIGHSFFGYRKEKGPSGLHSASHSWSWIDPGEKLLHLLKQVTDTGGFTSMNVDIFLTREGKLLINELQTVFGCTTPAEQMKIDGVEGRYLWDENHWRFDPGEFSRNHMCNLRIQHLLAGLKKNKGL
jgi:hypothetical protein